MKGLITDEEKQQKKADRKMRNKMIKHILVLVVINVGFFAGSAILINSFDMPEQPRALLWVLTLMVFKRDLIRPLNKWYAEVLGKIRTGEATSFIDGMIPTQAEVDKKDEENKKHSFRALLKAEKIKPEVESEKK